MKPISDVRRENLATLVEAHGGQSAFAQLIGKDKNQVYQWLLAPGGPQSRNIGHRSARLIESVCGKPDGWLDISQDKFLGSESQLLSLDTDILHEALTLLMYDEFAGGEYPARERTDRLAQLYQWVGRDGGRLTAASNVEFTDQVSARRQTKGAVHDKRGERGSSKSNTDRDAPGSTSHGRPDAGRVPPSAGTPRTVREGSDGVPNGTPDTV